MADEKISAMPAASALSGAELLAGVQSGANVKITATQVQTLSQTGAALLAAANAFATQQTITDSAAAQLLLAGWSDLNGGSTNAGQVTFGTGVYGRVYFDGFGVGGYDNFYNDPGAAIQFRTNPG